MKVITSEHNPVIKRYLKILVGKYSKENIKLPLEGFHLIDEALKQGVFIDQFFFSPEVAKLALIEDLLKKMPQATEKVAISYSILDKITQAETPQGVAAIASYPSFKTEDIISKTDLMAIVVDRLQDPGNFGTIIRTSAAAGFDAVFFTPGTVKITNPKVLRSTAGSIFNIKVLPVGVLSNFCSTVKNKRISMIATDPQAKCRYYDADFKKPTIIVIGNENNGISSELLSHTDTRVSIPLKPEIESINAAVAAGIIIYEAYRQRL